MTAATVLFVRLYLDVNVHHWLARDLRTRRFDVVHALDLGHERLSDEQHLRWAARHGRALLSFDNGDFRRLATEWVVRGDEHAGILLCKAPPRLPLATFHRRLLAFLDRVTADEMFNQVRWLDEQWD